MHAASYIAELKAMKKAGISNWQVFQTATINTSFILGNEKETGSISVGKKADMVLLNANPVDQLENLEKVNLVFNKGHIISPDTLIKERRWRWYKNKCL
jgi:imidazolonepropionase-like amidohydrolase